MSYPTVYFSFILCVFDGVGMVPPRGIFGYSFAYVFGYHHVCIFWLTFHWRFGVVMTPGYDFKFTQTVYFTFDVFIASFAIAYSCSSIFDILKLFSSSEFYWSWMILLVPATPAGLLRHRLRLSEWVFTYEITPRAQMRSSFRSCLPVEKAVLHMMRGMLLLAKC